MTDLGPLLIKGGVIGALLVLVTWCQWGQVVNGLLIALAIVMVWIPNGWLRWRR
ncbi:hypothetical protein [Lacticaseibacillus thailandensis]|uniref:Uncharacterized protein n=1 Tax=Lacticaseibacillus thailandensis DSM 22698 = JCM 13996 TaxID=1423810 RepID=A0A0R2C527_9LACO|nr:hypothetical protein [Lacticaseibacillus thailandensis]KRM86718.1 hypothetical protein FD19_GL001768 [Lacticaseibacillus thailandensis DSM 22698 = JCM 13996]